MLREIMWVRVPPSAPRVWKCYEKATRTTNAKWIKAEQKEIKKIFEINIPKENITKDEILDNIKEIINQTKIGVTYEFQQDDFSILIYPADSKFLTNKTHINFMECEFTLKNHYHLPNESIITFFQMEISNANERSLVNQVEYQVYDENKNILDLSLCNDTNIKIFYGIKNNSNNKISYI